MARARNWQSTVVEGPSTISSGRAAFEQQRDALPRLAQPLHGALRLRVARAGLHARREQIVAHPVRHAAEHERAAGIVEIGEAVGERRELAADVVEIKRHRSCFQEMWDRGG